MQLDPSNICLSSTAARRHVSLARLWHLAELDPSNFRIAPRCTGQFSGTEQPGRGITCELGRYCGAAPALRVPSAALARLKPLPGMCMRSCGPFAVPGIDAGGFALELCCNPSHPCHGRSQCCSLSKDTHGMVLPVYWYLREEQFHTYTRSSTGV